MIDQKCLIPRGKVIGGSSSINCVFYSRGSKYDYKKWADLGNLAWSFDEVLPYFKKSENSQMNDNTSFHGKGGFWNVETSSVLSKTRKIFFEAFKELNVPIVDYNGHTPFGVSSPQANILHGKRQSTGTAFLDKARRRCNLEVITNALVTKIIIDKKSKTARGVEFIKNDKKYKTFASKEIILSAGAINSPQVLMLSGIGPKSDLIKLGIKVIQDSPAVGQNLREHAGFLGLNFRTNYSRPNLTLQESVKSYLKGEGLLTVPFHYESVYFTSTKKSPKNLPSIEVIFCPLSNIDKPIFAKSFNLNNETIDKFLPFLNENTDIMMLIFLLHPKSKGQILLNSSNPLDFPIVDYKLFSEDEDVETLLEGIEKLLKLLKTKTFKSLNATLVETKICDNFKIFSKNYWKCAIRQLGFNFYHPCCTTSMGRNINSSVVNADLEVHGISKLRVVDVGVFPTTLSGHYSAPVVMMAEKISDKIKQKYL